MDEYAVSETTAGTTTSPGSVKRWIIEHEDRASFLFLYIGAAVVLSIVISLFWLAAVVAVHLLFELIAHSTRETRPARVWAEALWEVKLDIALILIALALAVYIHAVFGVLGLSTAARAAGAGARFVALQRALRGILTSLDDGLLLMRGLAKKLGGRSGKEKSVGNEAGAGAAPAGENAQATTEARRDPHDHGEPGDDRPPWRQRWGVLDWASFVIAAGSIGLIVAAPWLTHHDHGSAIGAIWHELHPWPAESPMQAMLERVGAWISG